MKEVMVRAHQIAKDLEGDYIARLKMALAVAWKEFKEKSTKTVRQLVEDAIDVAVEEKGADDYFWNTWEKYGKKRIYISLVWYKKKGGVSKEIKCGYLDLNDNTYCSYNKYTKQYDLLKKRICLGGIVMESTIQVWSDNSGEWANYTKEEVTEYISFSTSPNLDNVEEICWHNASAEPWLEIIYKGGANKIYNGVYGTYVLQ